MSMYYKPGALAKKRVGQAYHKLDSAVDDLKETYTIFFPDHPDMATEIVEMAGMLKAVQKGLEQFSLEAWNDTDQSIKIWWKR